MGVHSYPSESTEEVQEYDSIPDTMKHSRRVDELLLQLIAALQDRVTKHDASKMEEPELPVFNEFTPKLQHSTYGSDEYKGFLQAMGPALEHHYANNRHHPEHFEFGVNQMTLIDILEMLADWKAATERHHDGDLGKSLMIQKDRFGLSEQLLSILWATALEFGWVKD